MTPQERAELDPLLAGLANDLLTGEEYARALRYVEQDAQAASSLEQLRRLRVRIQRHTPDCPSTELERHEVLQRALRVRPSAQLAQAAKPVVSTRPRPVAFRRRLTPARSRWLLAASVLLVAAGTRGILPHHPGGTWFQGALRALLREQRDPAAPAIDPVPARTAPIAGMSLVALTTPGPYPAAPKLKL